jgi:exopolysaccharide biosynthesis polyprenyl glycosylphosphotransferase
MLPYDVRLRREMTQRRLAISLARRTLRVLSLHALDAVLLAGVVALLADAWGASAAVRPLTPAVVLVFLLSLNALSAYDPGDARRDRKRLGSGVLLALMILGALASVPPHLPFAGSFLAVLGGAAFVALAVGRKIADQVVRQAYVRGYGLRRAVIVGGLDEAGRAIRELRDDRRIDQYIVGHLSLDGGDDPSAVGGVRDLPRVLDGMDVQEVLVATVLPPETMREVSETCFERGTALFVIPTVAEGLDCWAEPLRVGECPLLRIHPSRLEFPSLLIKRGVDIAAAGLALLLLSPLIALIALAIKADSPGPVFFRQQRVGLGGRLFTMWKFRSMAADAEARELELAHLNIYGNGTFKLRDDPRVTRVGRWLRRTSMDELPQLLNVLWGDMSLVGPRPALVNDIDRYEPHHFERLTVVPGITGPWQVSGRNLITDFETIVKMERDYIGKWSLLLDLKILLRTVGVVLRGEGAY